MSDSEDFMVTYTEASNPFEDLSDIGSLGEDLEEDDEDPKEDPADYPTGTEDDEEEESSGDNTPISLPSETEVANIPAIPTPPLSLLSSPLPQILVPLPQILSSSLLISPPPLPASLTYSLGYRAAMIMLRAESPSTSPQLPSSLRFEIGGSSSAPTTRPTRGFRADYGYVGTLDDEIRRYPTREVGYRIADTWDEMVEDMQGTPAQQIEIVGLRAADRTRQTQLVEALSLLKTLRTQMAAL
nr:hypothetical protein [Tanacetum cinerariifolium]